MLSFYDMVKNITTLVPAKISTKYFNILRKMNIVLVKKVLLEEKGPDPYILYK